MLYISLVPITSEDLAHYGVSRAKDWVSVDCGTILYIGEIMPALIPLTMKLLLLASRVAQSVGHLTRKSGVLGSIPGLATYFRFSFHFFKKGSCQLLAKVCARSTG